MSKLIIEMEMPKCCDDCDANYDCCACGISGAMWFHNPRYKEFDSSKERLPNCPIKGELPETHGRLVDADFCSSVLRKLENEAKTNIEKLCYGYAASMFEEAFTIIAAERKDDEQIH